MVNNKIAANTIRAIIILGWLSLVGCQTMTAAQVCDQYYIERNSDWVQCEQNERMIRAADFANSMRMQESIRRSFQPVQPIYTPNYGINP